MNPDTTGDNVRISAAYLERKGLTRPRVLPIGPLLVLLLAAGVISLAMAGAT